MGNYVEYPIYIYQGQQSLPWVSTKQETWLMSQRLSEWNPQQRFSQAVLTCQKNQDGSYSPVTVKGTNISESNNIIAQNMPAASNTVMSAAITTGLKGMLAKKMNEPAMPEPIPEVVTQPVVEAPAPVTLPEEEMKARPEPAPIMEAQPEEPQQYYQAE